MSIAREIQLRLKSGNAIPVDSCRITLKEFTELCREIREGVAERPQMPTVRANPANDHSVVLPQRTGLVAQLYDSAQLSTLPGWCRKLLERAAEEISAREEAATPCAAIPTLTREEVSEKQTWKGMDGAIAYHLIDRHADNWADVGLMMDAWREMNGAAAEAPPGMMLVQEADIRALVECNFGRFGLPPRAELAARRLSDELKAKKTTAKPT